MGTPRRFLLLLGCWFVLQVLIRVAISSTANLDEAEQLMLTQEWSWGYGPQPPLYTWIQRLFFDVLGPSIFALALLKNLILFGTYTLIYTVGRKATNRHEGGVIAALSLLFIPQIVWESQRDLTHSVLAAMIAPALLLVAMQLIRPRSGHAKGAALGWYLCFGFLTAAGVLGKYNFVFWPLGLLIAGLLLPETRRHFLNWKSMAAAALALSLLYPHAQWASKNREALSQTSYKFKIRQAADAGVAAKVVPSKQLSKEPQTSVSILEKHETWQLLWSRVKGTWNLLFAAFRFAAPVVVLHLALAWLSRNQEWDRSVQLEPDATILRWLSACGLVMLGLLLVVVLVSGASGFKDRWFQPILICIPIWLTLKQAQTWNFPAVRALGILSIVVLMLVAFLIPGKVLFAGTTRRDERLTYPMNRLAEQLSLKIPRGAMIVAESPFIAGNLRTRMPGNKLLTPLWPISKDREGVRQEKAGVWFVWDARTRTNAPLGLLRQGGWKPSGEVQVIALPIHGQKNRTYHLGLTPVIDLN